MTRLALGGAPLVGSARVGRPRWLATLALGLALPLAALSTLSCSKSGGPHAPAPNPSEPSVAAPPGSSASDDDDDDDTPRPAKPPAAEPEPAAPAAPAKCCEPSIADEDLKTEEAEANPRSETVKVKLSVDPPVRGTQVLWGRKNLGKPPLELERPRYSGPLDLVIVAPGYLPMHTRAFTDRDDKVHVRLRTAGEAVGMLGWKRPEPTPGPGDATTGKPGQPGKPATPPEPKLH